MFDYFKVLRLREKATFVPDEKFIEFTEINGSAVQGEHMIF
jgi:hypothetical protein